MHSADSKRRASDSKDLNAGFRGASLIAPRGMSAAPSNISLGSDPDLDCRGNVLEAVL